jgi:hypothetical protein
MSNRATGATTAQIEAAFMRRFRNADWTSTTQEAYRDIWEEQAREHAAYLIPPDHRIIGPDDITVIRQMCTELKSRGNLLYVSPDEVDRLAALIGGDGNG